MADVKDPTEALAEQEPRRFEIGSGNWVTTRFTDEAPLPQDLWCRWLEESHDGAA